MPGMRDIRLPIAALGQQMTHAQHEAEQQYGHADQQLAGMGGRELAPIEHQLRHPRDIAPGALIDFGEFGDDVADQEERDAAADQKQYGRIDRGTDDLAAHGVDALLVVDEASQGARQVAGAFGGFDDADIQRREQFGLFGQNLEKRLPSRRPVNRRVRIVRVPTLASFSSTLPGLRRWTGRLSTAPTVPG